MELSRYLTADRILPDLVSRDREGVLAELTAAVVTVDPGLRFDDVLAALRERERLGSTGLGDGFAIPHARFPDVTPVLIFGRSREGIPFDALDGRPVHFFFAVIAPEEGPERHLTLLAAISRLLRDAAVRRKLPEATTGAEILRILLQGERT